MALLETAGRLLKKYERALRRLKKGSKQQKLFCFSRGYDGLGPSIVEVGLVIISALPEGMMLRWSPQPPAA
jgi:hypothetical protein